MNGRMGVFKIKSADTSLRGEICGVARGTRLIRVNHRVKISRVRQPSPTTRKSKYSHKGASSLISVGDFPWKRDPCPNLSALFRVETLSERAPPPPGDSDSDPLRSPHVQIVHPLPPSHNGETTLLICKDRYLSSCI